MSRRFGNSMLKIPKRFFQTLQRCLEGIDLILHFRQPAKQGIQTLVFAQRTHRYSPVYLPGADNLSWENPRLGTDDDATLNPGMISESNLSTDDGVIFDDRAARDSCLRFYNPTPSDLNVMSDLNQII